MKGLQKYSIFILMSPRFKDLKKKKFTLLVDEKTDKFRFGYSVEVQPIGSL